MPTGVVAARGDGLDRVLLAQHVLRHKTYKPGFVTVTALITALHVLTLGLIMFGVYAPGSIGDFFRQSFHG